MTNTKRAPILCLDFDGVVHSYDSGWQGPRAIPDPPVPGALQFIVEALEQFDVHIFSSRTRYWFGRRAMKRWLLHHLMETAVTYETTPQWLKREIHAFADPWADQVGFDMRRLVNQIKWPKHKPPALVAIDDRAVCFDGTWPALAALREFKPWNKR